jgi:sugar lactone lactonase YvrE
MNDGPTGLPANRQSGRTKASSVGAATRIQHVYSGQRPVGQLAGWLGVAAVCIHFDAAPVSAAPVSDTHTIKRLVPASVFHGVHGLAFDRNDTLYAGSVVGQSVYRVDTRSGAVETVVGPPQGMADDIVFLADGTMVWTAISQGVVRSRTPDGRIHEIAKLASINSINVRKSDGRLFAAQVFGGDGVWELDPTGVRPPRSILKDAGGFNGFDVGPDGLLYGPLWFRRQVVRIHPDTGELKVIAAGFGTPAAANFDSKWNLYVLDAARGEVVQVDVESGAKRVVAKLATSLDNLAIDSKDRVFVSNMADNGIQEVDVRTGAARQLVKGALAMPLGLAAVSDGAQDTLYIADVFAFRSVDGRTGAVADLARSHAANSPIEYPIAVSANDRHIVLVNNEGLVQRYDRRTSRVLHEWREFRGVQSAVELQDGSLVLAETAAGKLTRTFGADASERKDVASALSAPLGLALASRDAVYVSEMLAGEVSRVDLANGAVSVVAEGLDRPQGLAVAADGALLVVESGRAQLTHVDPGTGATSVIARDLPIGLNVSTSLVGVATGANGAIYVTSDIENSIWKLTPLKREVAGD